MSSERYRNLEKNVCVCVCVYVCDCVCVCVHACLMFFAQCMVCMTLHIVYKWKIISKTVEVIKLFIIC